MTLSGLHLLLTYQCNMECDHCFVWGSPRQSGTMTLGCIRRILRQARNLDTVKSIYFEGGEPFLYYPVLVRGVRMAARMGFRVGVVSNAYWATQVQDAVAWLRPLARRIQDLSVSSDLYHWDEQLSQQARHASAAALKLGISSGTICVAQPEATSAAPSVGQLPPGESAVMYRGRAAEKLVGRAARQAWERFTECPHEDLREPGRVHVDAFGNLHICQGIVVGNLFRAPLERICRTYAPDLNPITGPLLAGGPAELARRYGLACEDAYADACHLCYECRLGLRARFPEVLAPDQMYGTPEVA